MLTMEASFLAAALCLKPTHIPFPIPGHGTGERRSQTVFHTILAISKCLHFLLVFLTHLASDHTAY